jgi:hypothetical protein
MAGSWTSPELSGMPHKNVPVNRIETSVFLCEYSAVSGSPRAEDSPTLYHHSRGETGSRSSNQATHVAIFTLGIYSIRNRDVPTRAG